MFQWRGQMLYFIFLCNEKKESCSYRVLQMSLWLPADENTGLMRKKQNKTNLQWEIGGHQHHSTSPLYHNHVFFNRSLHYGVGGCVHLCMCFGLHWCFKLESCKIYPATESQSKLYHERSYLTLYNSEQAWEANHWGCFETNGFLPNGKCSY